MLPPTSTDAPVSCQPGKEGNGGSGTCDNVAHSGMQAPGLTRCGGHGSTGPVEGHDISMEQSAGQHGDRQEKGGAPQRGQAERGTGVVNAMKQAVLQSEYLGSIYMKVAVTGKFNHMGARIRVPSGLKIRAWRAYLDDYHDRRLPDYLEFGWPVNFRRESVLSSTMQNHASARECPEHLDYYIKTELGFGALSGPFATPPVRGLHLSPLMTRIKKDSVHSRVIMDLSWPAGQSVNDGIDSHWYIDGVATVHLPTVDYMEQRLLHLGRNAFMYKTDLARGYRQLRVDPLDWPLLGFGHRGCIYMDVCPPFGLRSAAMCMQRTSEAVCFRARQAGVCISTIP